VWWTLWPFLLSSSAIITTEEGRWAYRQVFSPGEAASPAVGIEAAAEVADSEVPDPASTLTSVDEGLAARAEAGVETAGTDADGAAPAEEAEGAAMAD